jgi:hypothetical protein
MARLALTANHGTPGFDGGPGKVDVWSCPAYFSFTSTDLAVIE